MRTIAEVAGEEGRKYVGVGAKGGRGGRRYAGGTPAVLAARLRERRGKPKREGEEETQVDVAKEGKTEASGKGILGEPIRGEGRKV